MNLDRQPVTLDVTKRLGDGYYEQRLVREQVRQLTGRRFRDDSPWAEAEYLALMNAAATHARALQLNPGIALTEAQMAQLTSDIVWLVQQTVTLPDGSTTQALVPQVYVRVRDGDLAPSGALLAGREVDIRLTGDFTNTGTVAGRPQPGQPQRREHSQPAADRTGVGWRPEDPVAAAVRGSRTRTCLKTSCFSPPPYGAPPCP